MSDDARKKRAGVPERAIRARGPERRMVTALFADIVDSTKRFDGRDLEEAGRELETLVDALAACVRRHRGTVAQEMGDGVMCLFGAPLAEEDHAMSAARAALDIVRTAAEAESQGLPAFAVRVGAASGEVLLRPVENGLRQDLRVIGPTVNLASKLQHAARAGQILLSKSAHELIRGRATGDWAASAYGDAPAFALTGAADGRRTAMEVVTSAEGAPIFGRARELARLRALARRTEREGGVCVAVSGEAGIGKSRLIGEFLRSRELSGWGVVLWPQSVERRLNAGDALETLATGLAASAGHPAAVCRAAGDAAGSLARAALEARYGLPVGDARWSGLDPEQRRAFLSEALAAALGELSRTRPLALVVEDAQWADQETVKLLRELLVGLTDMRVLATLTFRAGGAAGDDGGDEAADGTEPDVSGGGGTDWLAVSPHGAETERLSLDRLSAEDVAAWLDHWLGPDAALNDVRLTVAERSEGVPLYLEESLHFLAADGVIGGEPGAFRLLAPAGTPVGLAPTVRGLIEARVAALPPQEARVLVHAAALGPSFHPPLLAALRLGTPAAVDGALDRLTAKGFLAAEPTTEGERRFRHGLHQEIVYATRTEDDRRSMHARILAVLRRSTGRGLPGRLEQLARHASSAEDWGAAYVYGHAAGRAAERDCRHQSASTHYARAAAALARTPPTARRTQREIDLSTALPLALLPQGGREADEQLRQAAAAAGRIGDRRRRARAASILGAFRWAYGDIDEAAALSRQALEDALAGVGDAADAPADAAEISARVRLGGVLADKGLYREAATHLRAARDRFPYARGDRRCGLTLYADVAAAAFVSPAASELEGPAAGVRAARRAYDLAMAGEHLFSRLVAGHFLARACLDLGDWREAATRFDESIDLAEAIRCKIYLPLSYAGLGLARAELGGDEAGLSVLGREYGERLKVRRHLAKIRLYAARIALIGGRAETAARTAADALAVAEADAQVGDAASAWLMRAKAAAALGDRVKTADYARRAAEIGDAIGAAHTAAQARRTAEETSPRDAA